MHPALCLQIKRRWIPGASGDRNRRGLRLVGESSPAQPIVEVETSEQRNHF